jgi:hypothetical protein
VKRIDWVHVTAWAEIISGVAGALVMLAMGVLGLERQLDYVVEATLVFLAAAGIGELLRRGHRLGLRLSVILQALQLVVVSTGAVRAELQLGPQVLVAYSAAPDGSARVGVSAGVKAAAGIVTPNGARHLYLALNLWPAAVLVALQRGRRRPPVSPHPLERAAAPVVA